jgi:hypothetical protein
MKLKDIAEASDVAGKVRAGTPCSPSLSLRHCHAAGLHAWSLAAPVSFWLSGEARASSAAPFY